MFVGFGDDFRDRPALYCHVGVGADEVGDQFGVVVASDCGDTAVCSGESQACGVAAFGSFGFSREVAAEFGESVFGVFEGVGRFEDVSGGEGVAALADVDADGATASLAFGWGDADFFDAGDDDGDVPAAAWFAGAGH